MHYHCEIVLPPVEGVVSAIDQILQPFNEINEEESSHAFWDFYSIGGRFAGNKLISNLDPIKIEEFWTWLKEQKITVSGFTVGKQELQPSSQISLVDQKWNELFPSDSFLPCPLFNHSNDQYGKGLEGTLPGDVCTLDKVSKDLKCDRVIIAGFGFDLNSNDWDGPLEAKYMIEKNYWNGVSIVDTAWDGLLVSTVDNWLGSLSNYADRFKKQNTPQSNWLAVTVDYHS